MNLQRGRSGGGGPTASPMIKLAKDGEEEEEVNNKFMKFELPTSPCEGSS